MHERQSTGWQLEENAPEAYEQYLVPPMFEPWAERLVDRLDVREGDRVLDVGCGTGVLARRAAVRVGDRGTVAGLDVNEGMLEVARSVAPEGRPAIDWRRGDAAALPFGSERSDAVGCQQALQFVGDPTAALRECHRVLVPGGRVAASVWRPLRFNPGYVELAAALKEHVGDAAAAVMESPFPPWDGNRLLAFARDAGFHEPSVTIEVGSMRYPSAEEFVRREAASSPLSEPLGGVAEEVRDALVRDVGDRLREYTDDEGVVFPMEAYVLTARR